MTSVAEAGGFVRLLETIISRRQHVSRPRARDILSRRLRIPPGTLENLARDRSKRVDADVHREIHRAAMEEAAAEARHWLHLLDCLRQSGARADDDEFIRAMSALRACRDALEIAAR